MQPRDNFNLALGVFLQLTALLMLWLVSHAETLVALLAAVIFSFLMLTNYCLIHEASHNNLNSNSRLNWVFGTLASCLFPISFTFYKNAHIFHHLNNRSEHEQFEYYDPTAPISNILKKHLQWYGIVIGTYWLFIPFMSFVTATVPWILKLWPFRKSPTISEIYAHLNEKHLRQITIESMVIIMYWFLLWNILDLAIIPVLFAYTCFAFNWSTRQYVAHAYTPIDKDTGALNLKVSWVMERILLYSNWHLIHHQHPDAPWHLIPELSKDQPCESYIKQYIKLWAGPKTFPAHDHLNQYQL